MNVVSRLTLIFCFCGPLLLQSCGYKAPPSPYLDEEERFAPLIETQKARRAPGADDTVPGVVPLTPRATDPETEPPTSSGNQERDGSEEQK